jgi:FixJ family two-component response regulator
VSSADAERAVIHLVDDDAAVLRALGRLIAASGHVCETHASAEAFLTRREPEVAGCAIVDLCLPGADGLVLQSALVASDSACPVIFLTGKGDVETSVRAMKGGAVDFLTKPVEAAALLAAIDRALELDADARAARREREAFESRLMCLTPREREVLDGVVAGRLNKQIAGDLGVAEKTVKVHRARVMQKMEVRTVADLVRLVVGSGS